MAEPLIIGPYQRGGSNIAAVLSRIRPRHTDLWTLLIRPDSTDPTLVARILAILSMQNCCPLLHPIRNPQAAKPPTGVFLTDGSWTDIRRLSFPADVNAEVNRAAAQLYADSAVYLNDLVSAARGSRPRGWAPLPAHLGLADPANEYALAPVPPPVGLTPAFVRKWEGPELLNELLCRDYRANRYLQHLSEDELAQRAAEALVNIYDIERPRALAVILNDETHLRANARVAEVLEELKCRHKTKPTTWLADVAKRWNLVPNDRQTARALEVISRVQIRTPDAVARFGCSSHLTDLLHTGRLRIGAASGYADDPSLNRAQLADELAFTAEIDVATTRFELLSEDRTEVLASLQPSRASVRRAAATDGYVLCTSRRVSARLFDDFSADACLLIHDRPEFFRRLAAASEIALPSWRLLSFDVKYYDSFETGARRARPLVDKPAKYEYQHEHRFLWLPPSPQMNLPVVWLEVGPVNDISELIVLNF